MISFGRQQPSGPPAAPVRHTEVPPQPDARTEDPARQFYWQEMQNTHPEPSTNRSTHGSPWHLPQDFMTWSDGRSLFAFGGVASSLPRDSSTSTMCMPIGAANEPSPDKYLYPAGTAKGEPLLLTNELWKLQLPREDASQGNQEPGSKGTWRLIGGGPSRAVDEYFHNKLQYSYFGSDYGGFPDPASTRPGLIANRQSVREEDFDDSVVGRLRIGASGPAAWPRARFRASAWGGTGNSGSMRRAPGFTSGQFDGIVFSGMVTRPCFPAATMAAQTDPYNKVPETTFLMPNDLWGFSATTEQFTFLGGSQNWIPKTIMDVATDYQNGYGACLSVSLRYHGVGLYLRGLQCR
jgi:hypothetical protein